MSLDQHRREVDRIDRELLRLLGERLELDLAWFAAERAVVRLDRAHLIERQEQVRRARPADHDL